MDRHWNSGARFAVFLSAFTWVASILGTNIAANMIPFGADISMIWPRYIDMKRGFFIVEFLGYGIAPWKILASAETFTSFLSGYGLFMASVVGIMLCDCKWTLEDIWNTMLTAQDFCLTRGNVFVSHLFNPSRENEHYYYNRGWNVQAIIAYVIGVALPFPGFVASLGAKGVSAGGSHLFSLGWILSFSISFVAYYAICLVWPTQNQRLIKANGLGWEAVAPVGDEVISGLALETGSNESLDMKGAKVNETAV